MTVSGAIPEGLYLPPIQFLPIGGAQQYLQKRGAAIAALDGVPLWFVHDGSTGTSHDFIIDAWSKYQESNTFEGTPFFTLIEGLASSGNVFRIWWAGNSADDFAEVSEADSFTDLVETIKRQICRTGDMAIRFKNRKANHTSESGRR